jgi:hypothetical protein
LRILALHKAREMGEAVPTEPAGRRRSTTFDRYGHLMPGNEEEAAGLLDAYLARAASRDNGATTNAESVRSRAVESGSSSPV